MDLININDLNDDCLEEIFQYLPMLSRMTCAFVCRKWKNFPIQSIEITDELIEEYIQTYSIENATPESFTIFLKKIIKNYGTSLKTLKLEGSFENLNMSQIILDFSEYCTHIKCLIIDGCNSYWEAENLDLLFENSCGLICLSLKNLVIDGEHFLHLPPHILEELEILASNFVYDTDCYLFEFLQQHINIEKIRIDAYDCLDTHTENIVEALNLINCESITELLINDDYCEVPFDDIQKLLLRQKNFKKIRLTDWIINEQYLDKLPIDNVEFLGLSFDEYFPHYSLSRFQNLRELQCEIESLTDLIIKGITDCTSLKSLDVLIRDNYLLSKTGERYFQRLENLETLKISRNKSRTEESFDINNIIINLNNSKNLKDVNLIDCFVSGVGINALSLLPNLTNFSITNCLVPDEPFINLVQKATHLKYLNIRECENVTNKFIQKASEIKITRKDSHHLIIIPNRIINLGELIDISPLIMIKND